MITNYKKPEAAPTSVIEKKLWDALWSAKFYKWESDELKICNRALHAELGKYSRRYDTLRESCAVVVAGALIGGGIIGWLLAEWR